METVQRFAFFFGGVYMANAFGLAISDRGCLPMVVTGFLRVGFGESTPCSHCGRASVTPSL